MTLEEALALVKRQEKQLEKQAKELEQLDDLVGANKKLQKEINNFKKEQEEIAFKLSQKEKLEIFKELNFDEKQFKNLSNLTKDVDNKDLKKFLEDESFDIFKTKSNSHLDTTIVETEKKETEKTRKHLSREEQDLEFDTWLDSYVSENLN